MKCIEITIKGKVQGVSYRINAQKIARTNMLTGYARNNPDGTVTIVAAGEGEKLKKLTKWCRVGSRSSKVEKIAIRKLSDTKNFNSFEIR